MSLFHHGKNRSPAASVASRQDAPLSSHPAYGAPTYSAKGK